MARKTHTFTPGWFDYCAAAHYLCVTERTVKEIHRKGLISASRINGNGHPRFSRQTLDALMEKWEAQSLLDIANNITQNL